MKTLLIPFNIKDRNGNIYTKESIDWDKISKSQYGVIGHKKEDLNILSDKLSHFVSSINVDEDGLYGNVDILPTTQGIKMKEQINNGAEYFYRFNGVVSNDGKFTKIDILWSFNAVLSHNDPFYGNMLIRKNKIKKIKEKIDGRNTI